MSTARIVGGDSESAQVKNVKVERDEVTISGTYQRPNEQGTWWVKCKKGKIVDGAQKKD